MAAEVVVPLWVEVKQQVQPTIQEQPFVPVEVSVNLEQAPALDVMKPTSEEMGIGDETANSGQLFEEVYEDRTVELGNQIPRRRSHSALVGHCQLHFSFVVESL